jgi:MarR family transcriptional repressor of emrRAB
MPNPADDEFRLANLLAAAALGLTGRLQELGSEAAGMDSAAATALVALLDFSPHGSLRELSEILGLTHSGAVRLVDRLAAGGLVTREPGRDERSRAVTLTEQGRTAAHAIRGRRHRATAGLLDGLSSRQRMQLTQACEVLVANLTRQRLQQRATGAPPTGGALCRLCDFGACGRPDGNCPAAVAAASASAVSRRG